MVFMLLRAGKVSKFDRTSSIRQRSTDPFQATKVSPYLNLCREIIFPVNQLRPPLPLFVTVAHLLLATPTIIDDP